MYVSVNHPGIAPSRRRRGYQVRRDPVNVYLADFLDRVAAVGNAVDRTASRAYGNYIEGSLSDGHWDDQLHINLYAARSLTGARVCLKIHPQATRTSVQDIGIVEADYSQATGITLNGTSSYLQSGVVANVLTTNSTGFGIYSGRTINSTTMLHGATDGTNQMFMYAPLGGDNKAYARSYSTEMGSPELTGAVRFIFVTNDGTAALYRDDTQVATTAAGNAPPAHELLFGAFSNSGTPAFGSAGPQDIRGTFITKGMNSTKVAAFFARIHAFQTELGRQV